jgi:hypothetical protein
MILLDTDHLSVLTDPRQASRVRLMDRLQASDDVVALPIPTVEEQLRGWLALIHRVTDVHRQIVPYLRLAKLLDSILPRACVGEAQRPNAGRAGPGGPSRRDDTFPPDTFPARYG